ncbi:hypothetical protein BFG51_17230 [Dietzia alimentaria]|uniref:Uncharacterized protein n=1 Tax=Dietzia maris TaxID=37915 RepID=A0AAE4R1V0_9ACTN|nr:MULTISPECIES: hypothetical protein [Dietzia]ODQ85242.1 hypothetical protein BFG51_17230 [Dietzia alimentaria]MCZ4656302.1 hypothetical protein [Dietzia kunjamensis]MDJ0422909.1 hypothetical protein [Dietzia kunjamensis]MDV6300758.1 hypothetical protein [Dietzia maris]OAV79225.1 hypothetical protein AYO52_09340 [Dietzia sp. 111N12-1]
MTADDRRPADDPWTPDAAASTRAADPVRPRRRGLFVTALVIFTIGVLFTVAAALTPFVLGRDAPTLLYLGAMLFTPVGFLLGLLYAILGSRPPSV